MSYDAWSFSVLFSLSFLKVCNLLDLLGDSEESAQAGPAQGGTESVQSTNTAKSAGGDLLDLLGGFEPTPLAPGLSPTHARVFQERKKMILKT